MPAPGLLHMLSGSHRLMGSQHSRAGSAIGHVRARGADDPAGVASGDVVLPMRRYTALVLRTRRPLTDQVAKADEIVDEAIDVGHGRSDPLVTHAKCSG